jgi:hypothetical protein
MISHISRARTHKRPALSLRTAVLARPWAADPDLLRRVIQDAVSSLSEDQRAAYSRELVRTLIELRLNVRAILYVSGVVELEPADLTPAEIAHLFRYLRLNLPWVLVDSDHLLAGLQHNKAGKKAA